MAASTAQKATGSTRRSRAEQREETRNRMLQSALDIIIEEGIRSVRHRAVAQRAQVSLGSTTYHFSSIEELIVSAFQYWRSKALLIDNPFFLQTGELLAPYGKRVVPRRDRARIGARIYEISVGYMKDQLSGKRDDRLLELAFHHECVRFPALRKLVVDEWQAQHNYVAAVHRTMGSDSPEEDARTTTALFRQLEHEIVISNDSKPDMKMIRHSLHRHLSLCLGLEIPMGRQR